MAPCLAKRSIVCAIACGSGAVRVVAKRCWSVRITCPKRDASFVQSIQGPAIGPFLYLGAKHMVTGYDHLLFLVGVIFFLYRVGDVVKYVSLFTLGHSTTLLLGVLGGVRANSYLIDAVIALSVVYKAFDNMDGFKRFPRRFPAEHQNCRIGLWFVSRIWPCKQASGIGAFAERADHEHSQFQRGSGDWAGPGVVRRTHWAYVLADARGISAARLCNEHGIDDGRIRSAGLSTYGVHIAMSESGVIIAETNPPEYDAPSKQQILKATAVALAVAAIIFVAAVLPAEFGIDPLHTGAAMGLMNLSRATAGGATTPAAASVTPAVTGAAPGITVVPGANGEAPIIKGVFVAQPNRYKIDSRELKLQSGEGMEIKYHMQSGAGTACSLWTATGKVQYEFHGEPDVTPAGAVADYFESYQKDDKVGIEQSNGTFTAPSTGIEGWFWDNESGGPVTIKLVSAGFYDYILQNKDDVKTRLQPQDPK